MRSIMPLCIAVLSIALFAGCDEDTASKLTPEQQKVVSAAETQLANAEKLLADLKGKLSGAPAGAKEMLDKAAAEGQKKIDESKSKLAELKKSSAAEFDKHKAELESLLKQAEQAVKTGALPGGIKLPGAN